MKESVVIFFFAGSNHISNVETLQSIYAQDCDDINLIICNDATYGFENERLLANFEEHKRENVQQVYFFENLYPMGEFDCQIQFWNRMDAAFYFVIHSGETFTSPTVLRECVEVLNNNPSADAVLTGAELWSDDFEKIVQINQAVVADAEGSVLSNGDEKRLRRSDVRDCMVLYRLPPLRTIRIQLEQHQTHIGQHLVNRLLRGGNRVVVLPVNMCKYSEQSTKEPERQVPTELSSGTIRKIEKLLQEAEQNPAQLDEPLFGSNIQAQKPVKKRNIHHLLHKLSTFAKIRSYAILALLLFIASALFLNLDAVYAGVIGVVFMIGAVFACFFTVGMLGCNLFYKRYPQRLVMHNGNS